MVPAIVSTLSSIVILFGPVVTPCMTLLAEVVARPVTPRIECSMLIVTLILLWMKVVTVRCSSVCVLLFVCRARLSYVVLVTESTWTALESCVTPCVPLLTCLRLAITPETLRITCRLLVVGRCCVTRRV